MKYCMCVIVIPIRICENKSCISLFSSLCPAEAYLSPLFLDCCGLVRRVLRDMAQELSFTMGPWNQAYQFDTLPLALDGPEQMQPGDLVFVAATYNKPTGEKGAGYVVRFLPQSCQQRSLQYRPDRTYFVTVILQAIAADVKIKAGTWLCSGESRVQGGICVGEHRQSSITYVIYSPAKKQRHDMVHVEIWLGEGEKTLGARWQRGR